MDHSGGVLAGVWPLQKRTGAWSEQKQSSVVHAHQGEAKGSLRKIGNAAAVPMQGPGMQGQGQPILLRIVP